MKIHHTHNFCTSPGSLGEQMNKDRLVQNHLKKVNNDVGPKTVYAGRVGIRLYILFAGWLTLLGINNFFNG